ncbi:hypothetical protein RZS08_04700, partial [Arthrospira platensis SPKY1]|nr:hypothetical protein [Arthrospira platensis SPKY1]
HHATGHQRGGQDAPQVQGAAVQGPRPEIDERALGDGLGDGRRAQGHGGDRQQERDVDDLREQGEQDAAGRLAGIERAHGQQQQHGQGEQRAEAQQATPAGQLAPG